MQTRAKSGVGQLGQVDVDDRGVASGYIIFNIAGQYCIGLKKKTVSK